MNALIRAAAGFVIACSSVFASAETLDFEAPGFATPGVNLLTFGPYKGYVFESSGSMPGGPLFVLPSGFPYITGDPMDAYRNNVSGGPGAGVSAGESGEFSWSFRDATNSPFLFYSIEICNCSPLNVTLFYADDPMTPVTFQLDPAGQVPGESTIFDMPDAGRSVLSVELTGVSGYNPNGEPYATFAFDNIVVGAVPEPSAYAMMLAGLGALGFVARRRKGKEA